jgi:hypothetical protein
MADDGHIAPRVAFKSHLDGDPKVRPEEAAEFNAVRKRFGVAEMVVLILTENDANQEPPFAGWDVHSWVIRERDGRTVVEREDIDIVITPDEGA